MADDRTLFVGLGASAGGVQAFRTFFEHVPSDSDMAFVAILHMSPEHDSQLPEILQSVSRIPVQHVTARTRVQPNHAYVLSPRQSLVMSDGYLEVSEAARADERRAPIDMFFRTLAESHGGRSACLVMSGTGADGSMGLKRVKERGGICLVQSPEEAEYPDMPRNALATGLADAALSVTEMPARLIAYRDSLTTIQLPIEVDDPKGTYDRTLHELFAELRLRTSHDFSNYKRATVLRRISRRMSVRQASTLQDYLVLLREQPDEAQALLRDLLISVTNFFRDAKAWETLEREVVPALFEGKKEEDQVRVWVPACATGEEAYSIAMLLAEYSSGLPESPTIQIFATDIDDMAIQTARAGLYTINDAADVSPERLRRFFVKEDGRFQVRKELREMVLFARHNLIKDPPFSHLDLVSCRNLLIYLNRTAQHRVMEVIHFSLEPDGYLMLGSSESIEGVGDLFAPLDKDAHIFRSRAGNGRPAIPVPFGTPDTAIRRRSSEGPPEGSLRDRLGAPDLHQRLLEKYAPPSVVVNADFEIVHLSDGAARFLHITGGEPSLSILKAIRPDLRIDLSTALMQAAQHRSNVESRRLVVRLPDETIGINLHVRPVIGGNDPARGFFLVLFEETESIGNDVARVTSADMQATDPARQMEEEVARVRYQLRSTVEQYETQAEELKASNEELQAINEEMRSATEELETSKEELQSLNEELRTVNQELKVKIDEQNESSNDVQNLINSTDIGTIFLDRAGRLKMFTPRARDIFSLIPQDRGRPIDDIHCTLVDVDIHAETEHVLERLERREREVTTTKGRSYLMRATPYRTGDDRIDGVVLTFVDITERKEDAERVRLSEERLRRALDVETVGVVFFSIDGQITDTNDAFLRMSGYSRNEVDSGRLGWDTLASTDSEPHGVLDELRATGRTLPHEVEYTRPDGSRWSALVSATRVTDADCVAFVLDITERHRAAKALRDADRRKNEFLATLAHELRNPLAPISLSLHLLRKSGASGPASDKALDTMERQVTHMVRLVDDLLEVSRITLGKIELRRKQVDLVTVVGNAIEANMPSFTVGKIDLVRRLASEPLPVFADPVRLTQIVGNLLSNAAKYTPQGGRVEIRTSRVDSMAEVSIRDSGVGIADRLLPHVFDLFVQGRELPAGHGQSGLGVGLALVRTLVEGHGGTVHAYSEGQDRGTEVVVRLPLALGQSPQEQPGDDGKPLNLTGRSVIVVDDNQDAADSLAALLSLYGADVQTTYNGADALAAFKKSAPTLLFIDIGMPGMDGLELARRIRALKDGKTVPLIALTGWGQDHDRQAAFDAGFDHHLTKPADTARLEALLSTIGGT